MAQIRDREDVPSLLTTVGGWAWRIVAIALAVYVIGVVVARLAAVLLPLVVAVILATIAVPATRALSRRGVPAALAAAVVVIGGVAAVVGLGFLLAPAFASQVPELAPTARQGLDNALETLDGFGIDRARINDLIETAREQLSSSGGEFASQVAGGLVAVFSGLAGLLLALVLLFFFCKDADDITDWFRTRTPERHRELVASLALRAWVALGGYVRGTATIALADAVMIGVGIWIIGVPLVLPLAVIVFLGAFLPVIGATIAGLLAILVALASGGLGDALLVLAVVVGVQQVEGNVLHPMVMRRAVALHPTVVLLALAAGATLAGIVGAFLSLPVAAVASAIGNELRLRATGEHEGPGPALPAH